MISRILRWVLTLIVVTPPAATSVLTFIEVHKFGFAKAGGGDDAATDLRAIALTRDGKHVYASSVKNDALVILSRDASNEALAVAGMVNDGVDGASGLRGASGVAVSPDGDYVYVAARWDNALTVLSRESSTGKLRPFSIYRAGDEGISGLKGASSVAVSPDGKSVYVTALDDSSLVVFDRDRDHGALSFRHAFQGGRAGVDGLTGTSSVAVSGDGTEVYATGAQDHALVVFSRDASEDALAFSETFKDGDAGVDGLEGAAGVAVSPDDAQVYVVSPAESTLAVFTRDRATRRLRFSQLFRDDHDRVDGLAGASSVAASPDGSYVFVAGQSENSIAIFRREASTGELVFVERRREPSEGVEGLQGVTAVAVSPHGDQLYTAGTDHGAVSVFSIRAEAPAEPEAPADTPPPPTPGPEPEPREEAEPPLEDVEEPEPPMEEPREPSRDRQRP